MTAHALILPGHDGAGDFKRWSLAAAMVVAAHVGLAASYALWGSSEPEGVVAAPAVIVDLAPMPVAPSSQLDLAPGPEMVEAQAAPKPPEQVEPEVTESIQKVEAPAEVTLPLPAPKARRKAPEQSILRPMPAGRTECAGAAHDGGAARAARRGWRGCAPSPSAASCAAIAHRRDLVLARLQQNKRYRRASPARAGRVTLSFTVDRNAGVLARRCAKLERHGADEEVLAMIQRAQPLPACPR
jgi:protein TonB